MADNQSTGKLSSGVLKSFADNRDYRAMDTTIGPAIDLYTSIPFVATLAACPGNDDWKKKTPAGVVVIDLNGGDQDE